ncbi:MAG: SUMF1/EgtB/PvdO family nonheme iron enzyme [Phycisphaerales bacterium]
MHPRNPSTHLLSILLALVAGFLVSPSSAHAQMPASPCAADISGDRVVNAADLTQVLIEWGLVGKGLAADIDGDGVVNGEDMAAVLGHWDTVCPEITGASPAGGPTFGGNTITVTGRHLGGATELWIGDQMAHKLAVVDDGTLTAVVPASTPVGSTGARLLTVVTDSGESSLESGYTYINLGSPSPPAISTPSSSSPITVPAAGGATVTITGSGFTGATAVAIDGIASGFTVVSDTQITAIAPAHAPGGMFGITVTTPGGTAHSNQSIACWQLPPWPCTVIEVMPDPAVVYDAALRTQILATGLPWRITESALGIEMLLIPNGTFLMGCSASLDYSCNGDESPNHWVTLTKPFYLGRYEVTQAQWQARTGSNPSYFQPPDYTLDLSRPVERVSWNDIVDDFQPGTGLRLPTEAEWEYACRAGTTTAFHGYAAMPGGFNEDSLAGNIAWYSANAGNMTHPVGQKAANGFGLHDMAGNVYEWCADRYKSGYYSNSPAYDPPGPSSGLSRVLRGGYCQGSTGSVRSSFRNHTTPGSSGLTGAGGDSPDFGFRVARTP